MIYFIEDDFHSAFHLISLRYFEIDWYFWFFYFLLWLISFSDWLSFLFSFFVDVFDYFSSFDFIDWLFAFIISISFFFDYHFISSLIWWFSFIDDYFLSIYLFLLHCHFLSLRLISSSLRLRLHFRWFLLQMVQTVSEISVFDIFRDLFQIMISPHFWGFLLQVLLTRWLLRDEFLRFQLRCRDARVWGWAFSYWWELLASRWVDEMIWWYFREFHFYRPEFIWVTFLQLFFFFRAQLRRFFRWRYFQIIGDISSPDFFLRLLQDWEFRDAGHLLFSVIYRITFIFTFVVLQSRVVRELYFFFFFFKRSRLYFLSDESFLYILQFSARELSFERPFQRLDI